MITSGNGMMSQQQLVKAILLFTACTSVSNLFAHYKPQCSSVDESILASFSLPIETRSRTEKAAAQIETPLLLLRGSNNSNNNIVEEESSIISEAVPESECRFYLAESALLKAGLGVFTAVDIAKGGETGPMPDICIYVANAPKGTQIDSHSWQDWRFHGAFDGQNPRAMCEGVTTLYNNINNVFTSTPQTVHNFIHTNAGLWRNKHPGAGSITHYFGIVSEASRHVNAGSEITIGGDNNSKDPSQEDIRRDAPQRSPAWLRKHGMCIDNIRIRSATDQNMGRGAFASYMLKQGSTVAPAPLQSFNRSVFDNREPEELIVNYSFQPKGMDDILLFPYGQGVGLINHSSKNTNVALRWSTSTMNHLQWLDLPLDQFWKVTYQGGLILEVFALRDITEGEELFLDYGKDWETAWAEHERNWSPIKGSQDYTYPADMDLSLPFRTMKEQKSNPYPTNLMTVCNTANRRLERPVTRNWKKPEGDYYRLVQKCRILKRTKKKTGYEYLVSLQYDRKNPSLNGNSRYIDTHVPHSAISWVDKPYMSDTYLSNAFRHPIGLPDHLVPTQWMGASQQGKSQLGFIGS